jgi:hypothetical protein
MSVLEVRGSNPMCTETRKKKTGQKMERTGNILQFGSTERTTNTLGSTGRRKRLPSALPIRLPIGLPVRLPVRLPIGLPMELPTSSRGSNRCLQESSMSRYLYTTLLYRQHGTRGDKVDASELRKRFYPKFDSRCKLIAHWRL